METAGVPAVGGRDLDVDRVRCAREVDEALEGRVEEEGVGDAAPRVVVFLLVVEDVDDVEVV